MSGRLTAEEKISDENLCVSCPVDIITRAAREGGKLDVPFISAARDEILARSSFLKPVAAAAIVGLPTAAATFLMAARISKETERVKGEKSFMPFDGNNILAMLRHPDVAAGIAKAVTGGMLLLVNKLRPDTLPGDAAVLVGLTQASNGIIDVVAGLGKQGVFDNLSIPLLTGGGNSAPPADGQDARESPAGGMTAEEAQVSAQARQTRKQLGFDFRQNAGGT